MTATRPSAIDVTRDLLEAADTDIAAFFAAFTDDCHFRMGNADVVVGRENIQAWVADYLGAVAGMRHVVLESPSTATSPRCASRSPTPCRTARSSPCPP
jgi:hypothetical protein